MADAQQQNNCLASVAYCTVSYEMEFVIPLIISNMLQQFFNHKCWSLLINQCTSAVLSVNDCMFNSRPAVVSGKRKQLYIHTPLVLH
jgi:hypothetical protein